VKYEVFVPLTHHFLCSLEPLERTEPRLESLCDNLSRHESSDPTHVMFSNPLDRSEKVFGIIDCLVKPMR
jgi:hypothetical protein